MRSKKQRGRWIWPVMAGGLVAGSAAGLLHPPAAGTNSGIKAEAGATRDGAPRYAERARVSADGPHGMFWLAPGADGSDTGGSGDSGAGPALTAPPARAAIVSCLCWEPVQACAAPRRVVVLVHGLDELGGIWDDLAPALRDAGYTVARFEYPNDQAIAESASFLVGHLRDLRARGATHVDLVCHSMGGLVARDALTRVGLYGGAGRGHADLPEVDRLITLGTPNYGSPLARYRGVLELRERIARAIQSENWRALDPADPERHKGAAADDLLPGSEFLKELNARALPKDVAITVIAARLTDTDQIGLSALAENTRVVDAVGQARMNKWLARGRLLTAELGDGVVPLDSTHLPGVDDYLVVNANHRSMVKRLGVVEGWRKMMGEETKEDVPPAIGVIVERLGRETAKVK